MPNVTDYSDLNLENLMRLSQDPHLSKRENLKVNKELRNKLRAQENDLKEELKKENEDTREQQDTLRETKNALLAARKEFLTSYKDINTIMTTKSMLKNFEEFQYKVAIFVGKNTQFCSSLESHLQALAEVHEKTK